MRGDLGLVLAVKLEVIGFQADAGRHVRDGSQLGPLGDGDVGGYGRVFDGHGAFPSNRVLDFVRLP
ncbi:hypothetical protein D3C84_1243850 [compost metagenome]